MDAGSRTISAAVVIESAAGIAKKIFFWFSKKKRLSAWRKHSIDNSLSINLKKTYAASQ